VITLAVPREPETETRVALVPEVVRALHRGGTRVLVERGAGARATFSDEQYAEAGAELVEAVDLGAVDVVAHVSPLPAAALGRLREGALTIGMIGPPEPDRVAAALGRRITALGFERLPRTSRAQAMDALSSQAFVAGYRCVLEAAVRLPRFFPLAMTAAGTVPPARVVVLGVGVAGLQAIATARRLGAVVSANDIRPDSAEEVRSVGATFIDVGVDRREASGGYARDLREDDADRQRAALAPHIAGADVLITTAGVPGRPAPRLVTTDMVAAMRPGSVVVDMAAATGGNVEGSRPGQDVLVPCAGGFGAVTVVGLDSPAGALAADASSMYAQNVKALLALLVRDGEIVVDLDDDILDGVVVTHDGVDRVEHRAQPPRPTELGVPQGDEGTHE